MSENKAQHTPGPWKAIQLPPNETWKAQGHIEAAGKPIAMTARIEDARLIAAAPELLEALEGCKDAMELARQMGLLPDCCLDAIRGARAAIAKAKGAKA